MKKIVSLLVLLIGILVVVSACGQTQSSEAPPEQEEGIFRIEVSRNGFNGEAQGFQIEVEEDQEVEITFVYGDGDFSQNNPHKIIIPEYGIETEIIDENNPEATVRFTATGHGEVTFMCSNVQCVGHTNLLGGKIVIDDSGHDE